MTLKHPKGPPARKGDISVPPLFTLDAATVPRHELPPGELPPDVAYQMIHDELMLDGNARLNVATFVTTWMEPQAEKLMAECFDKNMIDKDEYPETAEIEMRCVNILANLWRAPDVAEATGCSTTGSSEAAMLGGLALKRRWQHARRAAGKPIDRPNLVMGINVQVCWEKFANYWDVEMRLVPMEGDRFHLSQISPGIATWYAIPVGTRVNLTQAGAWYVHISIPIFQFITLRWYLRMLIWYLLLWRVSRLKMSTCFPHTPIGPEELAFWAAAVSRSHPLCLHRARFSPV